MNFKGEVWSNGGDHIVELGSFVDDIPCLKLGLHLSEPQLRVCWPEGQDLDSNNRDGRECRQRLRWWLNLVGR